MAKFKNKKTGKIVEVDLLYYVNQLHADSDYKEIKPRKEKEKVEEKPLE